MHMRDSVPKFCSHLHLANYNTNFTHFEGSERAGSGGCAECLNTPHQKANTPFTTGACVCTIAP